MPACITTVSGEGGAAKSLPKVVEARLPLRSQIPSPLFEALDRIVCSTERHKLHHSLIAAGSEIEEDSAPHAVAAAAAGLAESIGAKAIVGFTSSGTTVARISRKRPSLPILAITPDLQVARRMALMWGAHSVHSDEVHSYEEMVKIADATVRQEGFGELGDLVVVVAGIPFGQSGSTNNLRVIRIGG